jgi:hypothetical protein
MLCPEGLGALAAARGARCDAPAPDDDRTAA